MATTPTTKARRTIRTTGALTNGAAAKADDKVKVVMTREKDTKNTVRYVNTKEGAAISALYINKTAAAALGASITVTVN